MMIPSISLLPALPRLDECRFPLTGRAGAEFLELAHSLCQYLDVYRQLFPEEYQRSMRIVGQRQAPLFPAPGKVYAPHERRFLTLVHTRLFPLDPYGIDEFFAIAEDRCHFVPICPIGLDDLYFEQISAGYEVSFGWLLLLYLLGYVPEESCTELFRQFWPHADEADDAPAQAQAILALPLECGDTPWHLLRSVCAQERGPLAGLVDALEMIEHDTGNIYLDSTCEMPWDSIPWEAETVLDVARQYTLAVGISERAWALVAWLEADPLKNFEEVVALWNKS